MSPGSRPSPSLPMKGHNRPATTSTIPRMISTRDMMQFRHERPMLPPAADLVEMIEQVSRVLVDPDGAGMAQLLVAIAAGQQPDAEGAAAGRCKHVPDGVADHDGALDLRAQFRGRRQEEIRVG